MFSDDIRVSPLREGWSIHTSSEHGLWATQVLSTVVTWHYRWLINCATRRGSAFFTKMRRRGVSFDVGGTTKF